MARPSAQEIQDLRDQPKLEDAYNKALRATPPASAASAPVKKAKGGSVKGWGKAHGARAAKVY